MRRMAFRFERILDLKRALEEKAKGELGVAVSQWKKVQTELDGLLTDHRHQVAAPPPPVGSLLDKGGLQAQAQYRARLEHEIGAKRQQLAQAEEQVEKQRRNLAEALKEWRSYEVLKERQVAQYKLARKRWEQNQLDEVGGQLHLRGQSDFEKEQDD